ncbi:ATP-binding protein [Oxalobacteraceae bacterium R-40]|uniref:histidine kinase n=1 Tax=Keguizhuia sedimenti TaxID=3064264 RepID=A0ABU1BIU7_9BURK|nr:ATP-binding protein [Oxalobacteraceae bacterium R-40]
MREKKTGHDIAKSINIFYFAIAVAVAFALPGAYFLEDYFGEKKEVTAWAEVQSATVNRSIEADPDIWPHRMRNLLDLIKNNAPQDDDDETGHSILDLNRNVIVKVPFRMVALPVIAEDMPIFMGDTQIGYYRVERSLRGLLVQTFIVAIGGFLLAFIIAFPLRRMPLRAIGFALGNLEEEKERALVTLQSIGEAVITTDETMRVEYLNPIAEYLTGWKTAQAKGMEVNQIFNVSNSNDGKTPLNDIINSLSSSATDSPKSYSVLIRKTDGKQFEIESSSAPIRGKEGTIIGAVMVFHDVTARRKAEDLLRQSQTRSENALNIARLGTYECNFATNQMHCSPRTKEMFEFSADEGNVAADYSRRILPEDHERIVAEMHAAMQGDGKFHNEFRIALPNGGIRYIVSMGTCEKGPSGTWEKIVGVFNDITERKNIEEQLRDADRRKDEFLATLAHELRNPLAPISAAAELLQMTELNEGIVRQNSKIIDKVDHMVNLVNDLLDVSRVTTGLIKLDKSVLDIRSVVEAAVEQAEPIIRSRRHHLDIQFSSEAMHVFGDKKRLIQVVANLLNNAAKYTPDGGSIVLKSSVQANAVILSITDNGIGIAPALVNHVFELFTQAERTSDRSSGGLGLGLALVKTLVELHGGRVACASEGPGKGSVFTVWLPVISGLEIANHRTENSIGRPYQEKKVGRQRILVVDDNQDAAETLAGMLRILGHEVMVENDSLRALERSRKDVPDVCMLDIGLPGMDGIELAQRLRSQPETAHSLLIAVTGYGHEQIGKDALSAGFDHYVLKPVTAASLAVFLSRNDKLVA